MSQVTSAEGVRRAVQPRSVWPDPLARALGADVTARTRIDEVWVVSLDLDRPDVQAQAVPSGAHVDLNEALYFSNAMSPTWLYRLGGLPDPASSHDVTRMVSERPWFRVRGNPWTDWTPQRLTAVHKRR